MKKLVLCLFAAFSTTLTVWGQSFLTQRSDTVFANYSGPGEIKVENNLKSAATSDVTLRWTIVAHDLPANWSLTGICDNNLCYTPDNTTLNNYSETSNPYSTNWGVFYVAFNGDNAATGSAAWVQMNVSDPTSLYSRTLTFVATKYPTSIGNVKRAEDEVTLYPNPARNNVNVVFDASLGVKNVAIYNLIGKAVKIYKVSGNSAKLDINDIPSGIYFVRLINGQGQIVATRKFTHQ